MIDTGAQHTYDEDTPPMSDAELEDMEFTLMVSLSAIMKKRNALDDEEQQICALIRETRNEICHREWLAKEIV